MTLEWAMLLVAVIAALSALAGSALAIYFSTGERRSKISNLDADTVNKNADTIRTMQETAKGLRLRIDNLETEIGEEKGLRRQDKDHFDRVIASLKTQYENELSDMQAKHNYEMKALEIRVQELEDELARTEQARVQAQKERDEARKENHGLLEDNYNLRKQLADIGE